jgi:hypothetical protein
MDGEMDGEMDSKRDGEKEEEKSRQSKNSVTYQWPNNLIIFLNILLVVLSYRLSIFLRLYRLN